MTVYEKNDDVNNTSEKDGRHKFMLVIDSELWEKFRKTIPFNLDATKTLIQMIQERVNYLEQNWNEAKKDESGKGK